MPAVPEASPIQRLLRQRFDTAAAKSLAVLNLDDAEPEMARFLRLVQKHAEQRPYIAQLFLDSFGDSYYLRGAPWEFLQFCMHTLRWPEVQEFIIGQRDADVSQHGARSSTIWNDILQAFQTDWKDAILYQKYSKLESQLTSP